MVFLFNKFINSLCFEPIWKWHEDRYVSVEKKFLNIFYKEDQSCSLDLKGPNKNFWLTILTNSFPMSGNNPEEISVRWSDTALPRDFYLKFYFDLKMPKMVFKYGYLSISKCHLLNEVPLFVLPDAALWFEIIPWIYPFPISWKHQKTFRFSDVFRG